jgi:RNA polymerase sigma-70 factor (ECF subfamily)
LWEAHYSPLVGWCTALTGDRESAQDIAAEAFTRLLSKWHGVRDPRGYLYVTAHNLVRDRWRSQERERHLRFYLECSNTEAEADPWLRDLAAQLPARMRQPVLLHYFADMPVAQVAAALNRPEGTIKRTLFEARRQLRSWLEQATEIDLLHGRAHGPSTAGA